MFVFVGFILVIVCEFTVVHSVHAIECCNTIVETATDCRELCHKLSVNGSPVEQIALLALAPTKCPEDQVMEFWKCAEQFSPVLLELGTFSGRPCCNLTKTKACREACVKAQSESDVLAQCSHSTEDAKLFECIDRQRDGEKCCGKAITSDSLTCKATCWNMYLTNTITDQDSKRNLRHHCTGRNKEVVQCLQKQTRTTRQSNNMESLHCCENTNNDTCRKVCTESLRSENDPHVKIDEIIGACGIVDVTSPLYQCLLKKGNNPPEPIAGIDSAKLHCCEKYESRRCGGLCVKTHSWKWQSIRKFEQQCGYLSAPISKQETDMHSCLKDVEEPCQLGCDGLQYCTNMNNRPTEHFRTCTKDADNAARNDILTWQKGKIILPNLSIPVKDIRSCEPEMWKAIACAYQIKPCYGKPSPLQICREDCVYMMSKCVDTEQLNIDADLCKRLPSKSSGECISVKQYTVESPNKYYKEEVTNPCKSSPCKDDEVCILHRRKCRHSNACPHYVCRKGCKMGEVSKVLVQYSTDVVIPVYKSGEVKSDTCLNYKVCHCSHTGNLGHCQNIRCLRTDHCVISTGLIESGRHFTSACNDCVCFGGEKICSKRQCPTALEINLNEFTDVQNCKCSRKFEPVCASNGKTYPSACIARCAGQTYYSQGSCHLHHPCAGTNPCEAGYRCVENKQICYGHRNSPCLQYKCVELNDCNEHFHEPVCDTQDVEFTNDCLLLSKDKSIGYRGHCQPKPCSTKTEVCGHDGETYPSECAALAARITIDYTGPCKTFGFAFPTTNGLISRKPVCENVACAPITPAGCVGIVPPWGCCPICAAELRVLVAEPLAHVSIEVKKGPLTLNKILASLSDMISISECDVFGYLGLDDDIIVLVAPVTQNPTSLQMSACIKEAERLEYLIQLRNPLITSNMILTPLLFAKLQTPVITVTSDSAAFYTQPFMVTILTIISIYFTHRLREFV